MHKIHTLEMNGSKLYISHSPPFRLKPTPTPTRIYALKQRPVHQPSTNEAVQGPQSKVHSQERVLTKVSSTGQFIKFGNRTESRKRNVAETRLVLFDNHTRI